MHNIYILATLWNACFCSVVEGGIWPVGPACSHCVYVYCCSLGPAALGRVVANHLRSAADELSKATYGGPNRPRVDPEPSKSSLIIYIIHISLPLSLHLFSSSPQVQLPLRLIGKVVICTQLRPGYRWGMQLIWIISLPHVVNNRLTGGRIQRVGCSAHCLLPAVGSG